jgi:GTPase SAR1 family protein
MFDHSAEYVPYKEKQARLARMLQDASETISALNMNQYKSMLENLSKKVNDDTFKVMVAGAFKTGKSTLINSFLGNEVLPAYATPCTAVINEIKYGKTKKAVLYFKHPLPEHLPASIPDKISSHMKKYKGKPIPPVELPVDEIEDYVVIPMGKDAKEMLLESPYDRIELFWPLALLENGVEIIDSPGLNEHATRTQVTSAYLSKADAVLYVHSAIQLAGASDMEFIDESLRKKGFEDVYFLVNRFDNISTREKERVKEYARIKLSDQTTFGKEGIFFVSALQALDGKMENDRELYESSGMYDFEKTLAEFLTKQKGKAKLAQPARELKRIINEEALFKVIPQQRAMLDTDLVELNKRYEDAKPRLDLLLKKKDQLKERSNLQIKQTIPEISRVIKDYFTMTCEQIPVWIDEIEVEAEVSLNPLKTKESIKGVCDEIVEKILPKMEEEQDIWVKTTLEPLVTEKVELLQSSLESAMENILVDLDTIRVDISGFTPDSDGILAHGANRAGAAIAGFILGLGGGGLTGSITGFDKSFVKTAGINIAASMALIAIFGWNPFVLVPAIIIAIIAGGIGGKSSAIKKSKNKIAVSMVERIRNEAPEKADMMLAGIETEIYKISDVIINGLDAEIKSIDEQVGDILSQIKQGQAKIDEKKSALASYEEKIRVLSTDLDNFIFQLIDVMQN